MRITVKVKPQAKTERIEKVSDSEFNLWVKAPAKEGKANEAVTKLLSAYFDLAKSRITIRSGLASKNKIVDID